MLDFSSDLRVALVMLVSFLLVSSTLGTSSSVVMILRKPVGNPDDFFLRDFSDYKEGFSGRGNNIKAHDM